MNKQTKQKMKQQVGRVKHLLFPLYQNQILIVIGVLAVTLIGSSLFASKPSRVQSLVRPDYFSTGTEMELYYTDANQHSQVMDIELPKVKLSHPKAMAYLKQVNQSFRQDFLGQYQNLTQIRDALQLVNKIDYAKVNYHVLAGLNQYGYLIPSSKLTDVVIGYELVVGDYQLEDRFELQIEPEALTQEYHTNYEKFKLSQKLKWKMYNSEQQNIALPPEYEFYDKKTQTGVVKNIGLLIVFGLVLSLLSNFELRLRKEKQSKMKKNQFIYLLNNFVLLYQTGLTINKCFTQAIANRVELILDNEVKRDFEYIKKICDQNYSLEGIMEEFCRRFDFIEARRFANLLIRNLRQGDHLLTDSLVVMTDELWNQRIRQARKSGEKASSKLVFPMLIIFIIIIILAVAPSLLSNQI